MKHNNDHEVAINLDKKDPLSSFRDRFKIEDHRLIYLDGNSLGRLPLQSRDALSTVIENQWGNRLIRGWNEGWYEMSVRLGRKLSPLVGAGPDEVIFADSTSQNLFKLITGALRYHEGRSKIVSDVHNFPSDIYLLQGVRRLFGNRHKIVLAGEAGSVEADYEQLFDVIDEDTALVTLSHVLFKSSFLYDMAKVTEYAHSKGALVLWDLSHSVGSVPVRLKDCNADFAVGCSYKYLNGGPGAPAFLYVRKDLQEKIPSPVWGWFGEENPFEFRLDFRPAKGIRKFLAGTPPVLSLSAIEPGLNILLEAGMEKLRRKSLQQTNYLLRLAEELLFPLGFSSGSPAEESNRGSHITLCHPEAYRICKALIDPGTGKFTVIPDFREPDNIRLGIAPLYTRFEDIYYAIKELETMVADGLYESFSPDRDVVT